MPENADAAIRSELEALKSASGKENAYDIGNEMKNVMFADVGIYRNEKDMTTALEKVRDLQKRFKDVKVSDTGKIFNTELLNAWELGNMLEIAELVAASALNRKESRGGHSREDFPDRDDKNWLKHTLIAKKNGKLEINYKPVVITKHQPKARVY